MTSTTSRLSMIFGNRLFNKGRPEDVSSWSQRELNLAEAMSAAKVIRRQFSENGIKGGVTVFGGGQGPTAVASIFEFHGVSTSELAQFVIAHLEDMGCGCGSSGPDDVRCTCPD